MNDGEMGSGVSDQRPEMALERLEDLVLRADRAASSLEGMLEQAERIGKQKDLLKRCLPMVEMWQAEKERTGEEATGLRRLVEEIRAVLGGNV